MGRLREEPEWPSAPVPARPTLPLLRAAAAGCKACPLWRSGTQTVFGEGAAHARVMMVGEQPGHEEDLAGRPFVGPAGRLLRDVMNAAGLAEQDVYVTNAVKHFKWAEQEGTKRRLHKKPSSREIEACSPWLEAELSVIRPDAVVCLGATAAQALLGKSFRVTKSRGELVTSPLARLVMATIHPSAVLRAPDRDARHAMREMLAADLRKIVALLGRGAEASPP